MSDLTKKIILISTLLFLLGLVYLGDSIFYVHSGIIEELAWLRELVLFAALAGFVPLVTSLKLVKRKGTVGKFLVLLISTLALYFYTGLENYLLSSYIGTMARYMILSFLTVMVCIVWLLQLRDLIFFKRRKNTARVFALLIISMALVSLYGGLSAKGTSQLLMPAALPIGLAVFNSFRISWITYINRRQKYMLLFVNLGILVGTAGVQTYIRMGTFLDYSTSVDIFVSLSTFFVGIYALFSFIGLLLHLPTAALFDRKAKEIESLQNLSRAVSSVLDFDKLSEMVGGFTAEYADCAYAWLVLKDEDSDRFFLSSSFGLSDSQQRNMNFTMSDGTSGWIYANRQTLVAQDVHRDELTRHLRLWNSNVKSLIGLPLLSNNDVVGILYAAKKEEWGFDNDDITLLGTFVNHIVIAIENARLVEGSLEKERLEQELRVAHDVQLSLLPKKIPISVDGYDIAAASMPANEVGGDYFDFVDLGNDRIGIVIGDVSGKGTSAAFYMAEVKGIILAFSRIYDSPKKILCDVNKVLYDTMERKSFISLTYAILDMKKRVLLHSRAGHMPILRYNLKDQTTKNLEPAGIGLGMDKGEIFDRVIEESKEKLGHGELYFFYTDGVTDARNVKGEAFGEERIPEVLGKYAHLTAEEIKANFINDLLEFTAGRSVEDDITLIIVKVE